MGRAVGHLTHPLVQKCHADDPAHCVARRLGGHVVREHAAGAESVQHDGTHIAAPLVFQEVDHQVYPIAVSGYGAGRDLGQAIAQVVDRDRLVAPARQWCTQDQ